MSISLEGKTVVVTGAGRGLGRALARGLAAAGASVWCCARTQSELDATAREIRDRGADVQTRTVDLAETKSCLEFIREIIETAPSLDCLINNAGVLEIKPLEETSEEIWTEHVRVNLTAPFLLIREAFPGMSIRGGSVINVSSRAGVSGFARESAYCASKFGLEGLTRALALEAEGAPVSLNTVTPGLRIKPTSLTESSATGLPDEVRNQWQDPAELVPAFILLAGLRGQVSGSRFDALRLARSIRTRGYAATLEFLPEMAE